MGNKTYHNEEALKAVVHSLASSHGTLDLCHLSRGNEPLPNQATIKEIVRLSREVIFPGFQGDTAVNSYNLEYTIGLKLERLQALLENQIVAGFAVDCRELDIDTLHSRAHEITDHFIASLPELRRVLHTDVEALYLGDPATTSPQEVVYCYPAVKAITNYRIAHALLQQGVPIIPRMISELAHSETGIDIHPGATIGESFAIDHGTGVVIGATAIIGNNVKLYQGVTLGALSFSRDTDGNPVKGVARHPIIGNNVIVYSNASILGRITIGDGAVIGGNIWVTTDVAPGERVVQSRFER